MKAPEAMMNKSKIVSGKNFFTENNIFCENVKSKSVKTWILDFSSELFYRESVEMIFIIYE